ncbi:MAG TPA: DoxX family protein [Burkholderiaceae bacterium]|nr:DoxX family protein [Burkholderiaceae bacterium]
MSIDRDRKTRVHESIPSRLGRWAALPLRLIVGFGFIEHGYAKIAHGPQHFVDILHAIGVPAPELMAWATILVELVGGLAVLAGALVWLVSVPMAAILLVATFTVHLPNGFASIKLQAVTAAGPQFGQPGYETDLLYLACLATLVLGGSGPLALDGLRARLRRGQADANRSPHERPVARATPGTPDIRRPADC